MALLIHLMDSNPEKQTGETHAGLILNRDEQLGWRAKVVAMPTKREIMRCVSDCPLTIAENILLWCKRHEWQIKLHPNSVQLKKLLKEVNQYNPLVEPDAVVLACAVLLKNFLPKEEQEKPGLPDLNSVLARMQATKPKPQPQQVEEESSDEIDLDLSDLDDLLNEEATAPVPAPKPVESKLPFKSKKGAIAWSIKVGAFENENDANSTYDEMQSEEGIKKTKDMLPVWHECISAMI